MDEGDEHVRYGNDASCCVGLRRRAIVASSFGLTSGLVQGHTAIQIPQAVDKGGRTVDFYLSRSRDVNAVKAFLRKATMGQRTPTKITLDITLDAYAASHRAGADLKEAGELPKRVLVRSRNT
jgi:hypothetical protein